MQEPDIAELIQTLVVLLTLKMNVMIKRGNPDIHWKVPWMPWTAGEDGVLPLPGAGDAPLNEMNAMHRKCHHLVVVGLGHDHRRHRWW